MTDEEIARFCAVSKRPSNRDEQEVAGYADLIGRIFDNWKTIKLSENWILQFHDILLRYSDKIRRTGASIKIPQRGCHENERENRSCSSTYAVLSRETGNGSGHRVGK